MYSRKINLFFWNSWNKACLILKNHLALREQCSDLSHSSWHLNSCAGSSNQTTTTPSREPPRQLWRFLGFWGEPLREFLGIPVQQVLSEWGSLQEQGCSAGLGHPHSSWADFHSGVELLLPKQLLFLCSLYILLCQLSFAQGSNSDSEEKVVLEGGSSDKYWRFVFLE